MRNLFRVALYFAAGTIILFILIAGFQKTPTPRLRSINGSVHDQSTLNGSLSVALTEVITTTTKKLPAAVPTTAPKKRPPCVSGIVPLKSFETYKGPQLPDVTVVTAYFNLGRFRKGGRYFDTSLYMKWSGVYKYLRNPFVFYTDSADIAEKFKQMRSGKENTTKIIIVKRESIWAFDWLERIRSIYNTPGYPKHHPNTVVAEYSCSQHAKYAVVEDAINNNVFHTKYFTWIDLGYFRNIVDRRKEFVLTVPPNFNENHVAMNLVYDVNMNETPRNIVYNNNVWIGGGMFFGNVNTLPKFIEDYRHAVKHYLNMSLSSTDQQVIYAMNTYNERKIVQQRIPIQKYVADVEGDCWFYLGYACYKELP